MEPSNPMLATEPEQEVDDLDELNEVISSTYSIASYGADYPVDGLVKRLEQGDIVVPMFNGETTGLQLPAGFQREFVWTKPQVDRFIESLLLGLPIPGIFLVKESDGKLLVLDGQQRLKTLQSFYAGLFQGKEFALENVQEKWRKHTYKTLPADDRRRLDDSIIHATIIKQDEPTDDQSSIYLIFERLNSGGTFLQPQEIRVALYHGALSRLLSTLNGNADWRALYGKRSARLKDLELILRFFALFYYSHNYRRPMKDFLNRYMAANRHLEKHTDEELTKLFSETVHTINKYLGPRAFRPTSAVNAAVVDALMVGIADRLQRGPVRFPNGLSDACRNLFQNQSFMISTSRSTADEDNVSTRLHLSREAFSSLE